MDDGGTRITIEQVVRKDVTLSEHGGVRWQSTRGVLAKLQEQREARDHDGESLENIFFCSFSEFLWLTVSTSGLLTTAKPQREMPRLAWSTWQTNASAEWYT